VGRVTTSRLSPERPPRHGHRHPLGLAVLLIGSLAVIVLTPSSARWGLAIPAIGLVWLTGTSIRDADNQTELLREQAQDLQAMLDDAERRSAQLAVTQRVVHAGLREFVEDGVAEMVGEVAELLPEMRVTLGMLDGDGQATIVRPPGAPPGRHVHMVVDAGGPMERILAGGPAEYSDGPAAADLVTDLAEAEAVVVAPIRGRSGALVGLLALEARDASTLMSTDVPWVQSLADQIGLVVEAVRAFERESDLAERNRQLDQMRREFLAITGHELRTPLTAVIGNTRLLLRASDRLDPETSHQLITAINRQTTRLLRLVDDLQTVTQQEGGRLIVERSPVDVTEVLAEIRETVPDITFTTRGPSGVQVLADHDRLHQILLNLIRNAHEHGGPGIEVSCHVDGARGLVLLEVRDDGPGIPADRRERIFDRFVTGRPVNHHHHGSGLGLSICRDLVQAMDGELRLLETETGTTFRVVLSWSDAVATGDNDSPPVT